MADTTESSSMINMANKNTTYALKQENIKQTKKSKFAGKRMDSL